MCARASVSVCVCVRVCMRRWAQWAECGCFRLWVRRQSEIQLIVCVKDCVLEREIVMDCVCVCASVSGCVQGKLNMG